VGDLFAEALKPLTLGLGYYAIPIEDRTVPISGAHRGAGAFEFEELSGHLP